jgi:hypothetical protein
MLKAKYIFPASLLIISSPYIYRNLVHLHELKTAIDSADHINRRKSGLIYSIIRTIKFLYMYFLILVYKRLFGTKILSKNLSYVSYFYNMKWYYVPIISKRGPKKIIEKVIENGNDRTDLVIKFAGPNVDFYGNNIRPKDINCNMLTITVDGENKTFTENEIIVL